jgi:hypothetical protein
MTKNTTYPYIDLGIKGLVSIDLCNKVPLIQIVNSGAENRAVGLRPPEHMPEPDRKELEGLVSGMIRVSISVKVNSIRGGWCYKPLPIPVFFPFMPIYSTPVTTQLTLPVTPDPSEEDIANTLEQLYTNLTQFLTSHHHTPNTNLLSHQPRGSCPIGSMPHPVLLPSHHRYPHYKNMTPLCLDLYLLPDMDSSPKIVMLSDSTCRPDLVTHHDSPDSSLGYHHDPDHYT